MVCNADNWHIIDDTSYLIFKGVICLENTFYVNLPLEQVEKRLENAIVDGSITGILIDRYEIEGSDSKKCLILVYEKHYYRAGNRLTLTVTIDTLGEKTRVHYISGGGGEGLFRFDWGAAESFADIVPKTLEEFML